MVVLIGFSLILAGRPYYLTWYVGLHLGFLIFYISLFLDLKNAPRIVLVVGSLLGSFNLVQFWLFQIVSLGLIAPNLSTKIILDGEQPLIGVLIFAHATLCWVHRLRLGNFFFTSLTAPILIHFWSPFSYVVGDQLNTIFAPSGTQLLWIMHVTVMIVLLGLMALIIRSQFDYGQALLASAVVFIFWMLLYVIGYRPNLMTGGEEVTSQLISIVMMSCLLYIGLWLATRPDSFVLKCVALMNLLVAASFSLFLVYLALEHNPGGTYCGYGATGIMHWESQGERCSIVLSEISEVFLPAFSFLLGLLAVTCIGLAAAMRAPFLDGQHNLEQ